MLRQCLSLSNLLLLRTLVECGVVVCDVYYIFHSAVFSNRFEEIPSAPVLDPCCAGALFRWDQAPNNPPSYPIYEE